MRTDRNTMSRAVAASLARYAVRRAVREQVQRNDERLARVPAGPLPTRTIRRQRELVRRELATAGEDLIAHLHEGSAKSRGREDFILSWDLLAETQRMALVIRYVRRGEVAFTASPLVLTTHALERLYERLGDHDWAAVRAELDLAVAYAFSREIEHPYAGALRTQTGCLLLSMPESTTGMEGHTYRACHAMTWVSDDEMSDPVLRRFAQEGDVGSILAPYGSD